MRTAGKCFAIPQLNLVELVRLEPAQSGNGVETVHGVPVYRLRGRILPLVNLNQELRLASASVSAEPSAVNIVVLQVDNRRFGLVVDEVHDAEEIVVKPLSKHLKGIRAYAGATIMGDGKLALILDVLGLAVAAGIAADNREQAAKKEATEARAVDDKKEKYVLFSGPGEARMALPLHSLARLEEIRVADIEFSGARWVVQYRGQILPLIRLSQVLPAATGSAGSTAASVPVLVLNNGAASFGLVVDRILDIVEQSTDVRAPATRPGVLYSTVIGDHVTELLDIPAIWQAAEGASPALHSPEASQ